jgi:cytochrome c-type biogenesis protein CcmH/NrfF
MRPDNRGAALALCLALLSPAAAMAAPLSPQAQIEGKLMCYCGCSDLTVRVCSCGTAAGIKQDITERLAGGQTADQVIAAYVQKYGEQILSAPTAEGFNILAWTMPFAVILVAGLMVVALVRRWGAHAATAGAAHAGAGGGRGSPAGAAGPPDAAERAVRERIARDVREGL